MYDCSQVTPYSLLFFGGEITRVVVCTISTLLNIVPIEIDYEEYSFVFFIKKETIISSLKCDMCYAFTFQS